MVDYHLNMNLLGSVQKNRVTYNPCVRCVPNAQKSCKPKDALIPKTIKPILSNTNPCLSPKSHSIQPPTPAI